MSRPGKESPRLPFVPPVEEGELAAGYIYRCSLTGIWTCMKGTAKQLADRTALQPPWVLPSNLNLMAEWLQPVFNSGDDILSGHSMLPLHLPFATVENVPAVLDHALLGTRHKGLSSSLGLGQRGITATARLAFCRECFAEDIENLGFAYWHRDHQSVGLGYCAKHGCPLVQGCGRCRFSQPNSRQARLPFEQCWCGQPHDEALYRLSDKDGEELTRFAGLAKLILEGALSDWNAEELGIFYQMKAREFGFGAGTYIRSRNLAMEALVPYSDQVLTRLNAGGGGSGPRWIQKALAQGVAPCVVGRNLLMFDFFGGSLPDEEDLRQVRETAATGRGKETGAGLWLNLHPQETDRQAISTYLAAHPGASRTELIRALGRTIARARFRDHEWLAARVESRPYRRPPRSAEERQQDLHKLDVRTSTHIRKRHEELCAYEGESPKMMTKSMLLKGVAVSNSLSEAALKELPLTRAALEECVESAEQHKRRYAICILKFGVGTRDERFSEAGRRTGLKAYQLDQIVLEIGVQGWRDGPAT